LTDDCIIIIKEEEGVPPRVVSMSRKDAATQENEADKIVSQEEEEEDIAGMTHCAICYEALHEGDEITTSNCRKTFHRQCIMEWLMQHDLCPYCRNPFKNLCDSMSIDDYLNTDCEESRQIMDMEEESDVVVDIVPEEVEAVDTPRAVETPRR
jgi:hypothetical protein